jgi:ribose 5-phosphate isomerase
LTGTEGAEAKVTTEAGQDPARAAVGAAAASRLEPEMLLGLGSGRAVWALIDLLKLQWAGRLPPVAVASSATEARAPAEASRSFPWTAP